MSYPDICVSGAGTSKFNGRYVYFGDYLIGGYKYLPRYKNEEENINLIPTGNAYNMRWNMTTVGAAYRTDYFSEGNIPDTPDLATGWYADTASAPPPTVTLCDTPEPEGVLRPINRVYRLNSRNQIRRINN